MIDHTEAKGSTLINAHFSQNGRGDLHTQNKIYPFEKRRETELVSYGEVPFHASFFNFTETEEPSTGINFYST